MSRSGFFASRQFAILLLVVAAPLCLSANMLVARWNAGDIPPVALAFWRWTTTLILLAPFAAKGLWRGRAEIRQHWRVFILLGFLGMGVCGAPVYLAGVTTTATNIGLIYAASPVVIVALAWARYGAPVGRAQALGIVLCLCGALWIVARGDLSTVRQLSFVAGDVLVVVAMVAWSIYSVLLKYIATRLGALTRLTAIVAGGVVVNLPFYIAESVWDRTPDLTVLTVSVILFTALIPSIASYLSYSVIVGRLGAGASSLVMYLVPLYGATMAWALLGEQLALFHLVGVALMLPGLYLGTRR